MSSTSPVRKLIRRGHRREEGQAAFEFLLMLPFFILFLLMAIDFGVLMYQYVSVSNAVREGARYGSVNCGGVGCTEQDVIDRVLERSSGILSDSADVTVSWVDGDDIFTGDSNSDRGDSVVVEVHHSHDLIFFPSFNFDVRSCADMRLEQQDSTAGLPTGSEC